MFKKKHIRLLAAAIKEAREGCDYPNPPSIEHETGIDGVRRAISRMLDLNTAYGDFDAETFRSACVVGTGEHDTHSMLVSMIEAWQDAGHDLPSRVAGWAERNMPKK